MNNPTLRSGLGSWLFAIVLLVVLPMVFHQGFALSLMSQMGIATIFALSYNMLLGQTGMLSFGHAVYFGLGAYASVHLLNFIAHDALAIPVPLLPLLGGLVGALFGVIFGYVTTQRSGTPFAMISLGIGELVAACSLMYPGFFGGEGGIAANRTVGTHFFGLTFGPQRQVCYLIFAWLLISAALMLFISRTPLGRMANAVRDNPERVQFVGYNPQRIRYLVLILASFFAGIAGGLNAINYELVNSDAVGAQTSGSVLLMTFIGGMGNFVGPVIGAVLVTYLQVALSGYTKAWLLYFGLVFLVMVLYAPDGIAGLIARHQPLWRAGRLGRILPAYAAASVPLAAALAGLIVLVELIYKVESHTGEATDMRVFGIAFDSVSPLPWIVGAVLLLGGGALLLRAARQVGERWDAALQELGGQP